MAGGKYLLIKGRAGLGNRMLAGATGVLYAQLCGRTPVFDWRDSSYSQDGEDAFTRLFDCPAAGSLDALPETASVAPAAWRGLLGKSIRHLEDPFGTGDRRDLIAFRRHSCIDLTRTDHPEEIVVTWGWTDRIEFVRRHLDTELARLSRKELLRRLLREQLRPRPEVADRVAEFRRQHLDAPAVGVHVRWSDRRSRLGAIERRLDRLLRKRPGLKVFLATDSAEIEERFARRDNMVTAPRWYPQPGMRMHDNRACPDPSESAREALVDMHLLAACDHLIGDFSSTFVETARLLSDAPKSNVSDVAPLTSRDIRLQNAIWRRLHQVRLSPPLLAYISRRGGP